LALFISVWYWNVYTLFLLFSWPPIF